MEQESGKSFGRQDDDLPLVRRILDGDVRAFEDLVRKYERRVFRVVVGVTRNTEDAEEAMQDAFLKAYRGIGGFRGECKFATWLTRIAVNEALQKRRARKEAQSLDDPAVQEPLPIPHRVEEWYADPETRYARQEIRQFVEEAVESLEPPYRVAFLLRDLEGLTIEEAAEALHLSLPAVKSRILRARLMVREALAAKLEQKPGFKARISRVSAMLRQSVAERIGRSLRWKDGE